MKHTGSFTVPVVNHFRKTGPPDFSLEVKWLAELVTGKRPRDHYVWLKAGFAF
jgi:hypothetical protein